MLKPSQGLTNWFCSTYKTTPETFHQHYGALAHELATHGHDIRGTSDTDIAAVINHEAARKGLRHLAAGGDLPPGQSAVVGDQPGNPNAAPEVVTNPASNPAPVQVQSNPSTGGGNTQAIVVGQALGISPQAVLSAYTPDQIAAAYAKFGAQQNSPGVDFGNKVAQLGAAAATYGDHDALKNEYAQEQTERANRMSDTVGQELQKEKSLTEGLGAAKSAQDLIKSNLDIAAQTAMADPTSPISASVRDLLKQYKMNVPDSISAVQAQYLTASNGTLNKQVNDTIEAHAKGTEAGAAATTAGTAAQKEAFGEKLAGEAAKNPNQEVTYEGGNVSVKPKPGEVTAQNDFATSVSKARDTIPNLEKSVNIVGDTIRDSMNPDVSFGKLSPSQNISNLTRNGPEYNLQQKLNGLKTLQLGNMVSTVGGAGELRIAGVDNAAMSQVPTVGESREAAVGKQIKILDGTIRANNVAREKVLFNQQHPSDNGSGFKADYSGKVSVWNPKTDETALVDRKNLAAAESKGFANVSDGYTRFLKSMGNVSSNGQQ